jgi:hypothetical protein
VCARVPAVDEGLDEVASALIVALRIDSVWRFARPIVQEDGDLVVPLEPGSATAANGSR